jgi:hypothetical protein
MTAGAATKVAVPAAATVRKLRRDIGMIGSWYECENKSQNSESEEEQF